MLNFLKNLFSKFSSNNSEPKLSVAEIGEHIARVNEVINEFDQHPMVRPADVNIEVLPNEREEMKELIESLYGEQQLLKDFSKDNPSDGLVQVLNEIRKRIEVIETKGLEQEGTA